MKGLKFFTILGMLCGLVYGLSAQAASETDCQKLQEDLGTVTHTILNDVRMGFEGKQYSLEELRAMYAATYPEAELGAEVQDFLTGPAPKNPEAETPPPPPTGPKAIKNYKALATPMLTVDGKKVSIYDLFAQNNQPPHEAISDTEAAKDLWQAMRFMIGGINNKIATTDADAKKACEKFIASANTAQKWKQIFCEDETRNQMMKALGVTDYNGLKTALQADQPVDDWKFLNDQAKLFKQSDLPSSFYIPENQDYEKVTKAEDQGNGVKVTKLRNEEEIVFYLRHLPVDESKALLTPLLGADKTDTLMKKITEPQSSIDGQIAYLTNAETLKGLTIASSSSDEGVPSTRPLDVNDLLQGLKASKQSKALWDAQKDQKLPQEFKDCKPAKSNLNYANTGLRYIEGEISRVELQAQCYPLTAKPTTPEMKDLATSCPYAYDVAYELAHPDPVNTDIETTTATAPSTPEITIGAVRDECQKRLYKPTLHAKVEGEHNADGVYTYKGRRQQIQDAISALLRDPYIEQLNQQRMLIEHTGSMSCNGNAASVFSDDNDLICKIFADSLPSKNPAMSELFSSVNGVVEKLYEPGMTDLFIKNCKSPAPDYLKTSCDLKYPDSITIAQNADTRRINTHEAEHAFASDVRSRDEDKAKIRQAFGASTLTQSISMLGTHGNNNVIISSSGTTLDLAGNDSADSQVAQATRIANCAANYALCMQNNSGYNYGSYGYGSYGYGTYGYGSNYPMINFNSASAPSLGDAYKSYFFGNAFFPTLGPPTPYQALLP